MRMNEERVAELHQRMRARERMKERRRCRALGAGAAAAGIALVVAFAAMISQTPVQAPVAASGGVAASIFAENAALGCVVVGLLAFCLGALVTALCFRLKNHAEDGEDDDDREL